MTEKQLLDRVERWRLLLCPEWRLTVSTDQSGAPEECPDARGAIKRDDDYHHAFLYISPRLIEDELGEVDVTIVHELVHLIVSEMRRTLDLVDGQMHRDVAAVALTHFISAEEGAVERLARVIAQLEHSDGRVYGTWPDE